MQTTDRIGIAVSGGPDSLALLLLAQAACANGIEAATIDHGLRAESAGEAAFVARLCKDLGIVHRTLPVQVREGSVQAAARDARYGALADWAQDRGLACVATAHHADDQAETLLMRLNRGSGVAGLAGIRARGTATEGRLALVRPLLSWRRAELAVLVARAGLEPVDDPSNRDLRFDRARLRSDLRDCAWLDVPAMAASAAHLAEADEALEWAASRALEECVTWDADGAILRVAVPKVVTMRVMAAIIRGLAGSDARGSALARAYVALSEGRPATLAGVVIRPGTQGWRFSREGERHNSDHSGSL